VLSPSLYSIVHCGVCWLLPAHTCLWYCMSGSRGKTPEQRMLCTGTLLCHPEQVGRVVDRSGHLGQTGGVKLQEEPVSWYGFQTRGWNSVGKLGEGQTRRGVFLDIKGRYLVRCGCRGCNWFILLVLVKRGYHSGASWVLFGTPRPHPPTIHYTLPRFILKDPGRGTQLGN
jgi:hypothetical protein